jgi:PAS domain S-box-containing protein
MPEGVGVNSQESKILIIDDEDVAAAFYTAVFKYYNFSNYKICRDSRQVMKMLGRERFSAVLLDLNMPHIGGQELLSNIKQEYPGIPVVVITGEDNVDTAVECMKRGAYDFLAKPVEKNRLLTVIKHALHFQSMHDELQASRESYWALSETTTDVILQINEDFNIQFANTAVQSIFGYSREEVIRGDFKILFPPPVYNRYVSEFRKYFFIDNPHRKKTQLENTIEVLGQTKNREIIPLEISFGNSKSVGNHRIVTCIVRDITQRKNTERKLRFLAYHDKLTNLGNRDLFSISLSDFLENVKRYPENIGALLFLDLDGFKKVNDTLGHDIGDKILVECSRRLADCLRKSDHVYRFREEMKMATGAPEDLFRFGGDEFIILLTNLTKTTDAAVVAQKIIDTVVKPYNVEGYPAIAKINLGVSVGIALIPADGTDANNLISSADVAMYKAKELGNRYVFFTREMNNMATERLMLEDGLRSAFDRGELTLHYQPLVDPEGKILGMEALLRWPDGQGGFVPPGKFIPIAEENGLILPMGDWVLKTACEYLRSCNDSGYGNLYLAVNFSPKQFEQDHLVEKISSTIRNTPVNPENIKIEVTESYIMKYPENAIAKMSEIKNNNIGIRIAIDDFGTGYSSLSNLTNFPIDILKIDQSFVIHLDARHNTKIINTIITMAHSLDLEIVAEGVETEEQLRYLREKNCHVFQGYYFSKPVPAEEMTALLKYRRLPAAGGGEGD